MQSRMPSSLLRDCKHQILEGGSFAGDQSSSRLGAQKGGVAFLLNQSGKGSFVGGDHQSQNQSTPSNFELMYKKSSIFKSNQNQFVNITDNYGKTALHYACQKGQEALVKILLDAGASLYIRDGKNRKPSEITKDSNLKAFLNKEEQRLEEESKKKMKSNSALLKRSLSGSNLTSILKNKLQGSRLTFRIGTKQIELSSIEQLAQYSNQQLSQFTYGIYGDNALTYMIRIDDRPKFEYVLSRGILPSMGDTQGQNALFYAILSERFQYLTFLLEGDYHNIDDDHEVVLNVDFLNKKQGLMNKSYMQSTYSQMGKAIGTANESKLQKSLFQLDALLCMDKSSITNGTTIFHLCAKLGNVKIIRYLLKVLKARNQLINEQGPLNLTSNSIHKNTSVTQIINISQPFSKSLTDVLEFTDTDNMTPLLMGAKSGNLQILKLLIEEGASVYAQCGLLQNALHYAIAAGNEEMIKYLIYSDAESMILRNDVNWRNLKPHELPENKDGRYNNIFSNIWEASYMKGQQFQDRLQHLLKGHTYNALCQTPSGRNTPLHFAIMGNNFRALKLLVNSTHHNVNLEIPNSDNKTPKDLVMLYKNEDDRLRFLNILNRSFLTQGTVNSASSLRRKKHLQSIRAESSSLQLQSSLNPDYESPVKHDKGHLNTFQSRKADPIMDNSQEQHSTEQNGVLSPEIKEHGLIRLQHLTPINTKDLKINTGTNYHSQQRQSQDFFRVNQIQSEDKQVDSETHLSQQTVLQQLNLRQDPSGGSSSVLTRDVKELERFVQQKQKEYLDAGKLGKFNPILYEKIFSGHTDYTSRPQQSIRESPNQTHGESSINLIAQISKAPLRKQNSIVDRKDQIEKLFLDIDERKLLFIDLKQILAKWDMFEKLCDENEQKRLKMYLERYYKETKITMASFMKIMSFYLD